MTDTPADIDSESNQHTGIVFSEQAQKYLLDLLEKKKPDRVNVRIFVSEPGTPRAETCLAYCPEGEQQEDDMLLELKGFAAYLEKRSLPFLSEAQVDYAEDSLGGQLTIRAPNARLPRLGEDSTLQDRVNYLLWNEINPMLASHGGQVSLMEITDDNTVVLQFGGGCQGCGMVDMTLRDGIEKSLREKIPEINRVTDVTDHSMTENAWFKG